jgi:hypothetical protein
MGPDVSGPYLARRRTAVAARHLQTLDCGDQCVDLIASVVERQRRADRALDAEPPEYRLRAMMSGPHGDAFAIEELADLAIPPKELGRVRAMRLAARSSAWAGRSRELVRGRSSLLWATASP